MKTHKKPIFIVMSVMLLAIGIVYYILLFQYKENDVIEAINSYLNDRYNNISYKNFDESIAKQAKYYSSKLISYPSWVNSEADIIAAKKYFEETGFVTKILTSSIEKIDRKKYLAKISVLYLNGHIEDDNFVNYRYVFTVSKKGINTYEFDNIELTSNVLTYINGGELHIHDGEAIVCNVDSHATTNEGEHIHTNE
ncbi:MAG: hypothetical protein GX757_07710 [Clostridiales bacterium]|nr:hypothetical protein [Clostridiales bacterium]